MFCMSISKRNDENRIPAYILSFTAGRDDHAEVYGVATFGLTATELLLAHRKINCWAVESTDRPHRLARFDIYLQYLLQANRCNDRNMNSGSVETILYRIKTK